MTHDEIRERTRKFLRNYCGESFINAYPDDAAVEQEIDMLLSFAESLGAEECNHPAISGNRCDLCGVPVVFIPASLGASGPRCPKCGSEKLDLWGTYFVTCKKCKFGVGGSELADFAQFFPSSGGATPPTASGDKDRADQNLIAGISWMKKAKLFRDALKEIVHSDSIGSLTAARAIAINTLKDSESLEFAEAPPAASPQACKCMVVVPENGICTTCGLQIPDDGAKVIVSPAASGDQPQPEAKVLAERSGWILCAERMPETGEYVHLIVKGIVQMMPACIELVGFNGENGKQWRWLDESADPIPLELAEAWHDLPGLPPADAKASERGQR